MKKTKTKIIQFIHGLSMGGAEKLVYQYALLLNKEKFDVYVIAITNTHSVYDEKLAKHNIKVIYLNDRIDSIIPGPTILKKIIHVIVRVPYLKILIRRIQPDVIHTHLLLNNYLRKARVSKNIKIVHTIHSDAYRLFNSESLETRKEKRSLDILKKKYKLQFISLNKEGLNAVNEIFHINDAVVINNGVEIEKLQHLQNAAFYKEKYHIDKDQFIVGHVGRLNEVKNQKFLLKVFWEIRKIRKNSVLWFIGDGPMKEQLKKEVDELGLASEVTFWGNQLKPEEYVRMMDIFIMPSIYEGVSLSMIECQIIGTPMLISQNIPDKAIISNLVSVKKLSETPYEWANEAINITEKPLIPIYENLEEWDIKNVVKKLEKIYCEDR